MKRIVLFLGALTFLLLGGSYGSAQPSIQFEPFVSGLNFPVGMAHAGDSRLFVVEKQGTIRMLPQSGQTAPTMFLDIRSRVGSGAGEQGLLGLAFPPDHAQSGKFYVNYTNLQGNTVISRFSVLPANVNEGDPASEEILMTINQPFDNHNAGCIRFGPDSMLYIANGDGGAGGDPGNRAQNPLERLGKFLRIDVSPASGYAIPADNPFVNDAAVLDDIWSVGWRNPWQFSFDKETGDMWIADVGQNAREEVNFEPAATGGLNYGWRCREGVASFNTSGCNGNFTDPVWDYPQGNATGKSVTGGFVYRGANYPALVGHYIYGDYVSGNVWTIRFDGQGGVDTTVQGKPFGGSQLTSFGEAADGELYALTKGGTIYSIESTTSLSGEIPLAVSVAYLENGEIQLNWENQGRMSMVEICDLTGRVVWKDQVSESTMPMPAGLSGGVYLVRIEAGKRYRGKVLVR